MIQFEYGREGSDGFEETGNLNAPHSHLRRSAQAIIWPFEREKSLEREAFRRHTQEILERYPSEDYNWERPDDEMEPFSHRDDTLPRLHGGLIASSSKVVQDASFRNDKVEEFRKRGDILAFEMEGYAVALQTPCLNIRGICDYADKNKDWKWQPYAAVVAAAFAKTVVLGLPTIKAPSNDSTLGANPQGPIEPGMSASGAITAEAEGIVDVNSSEGSHASGYNTGSFWEGKLESFDTPRSDFVPRFPSEYHADESNRRFTLPSSFRKAEMTFEQEAEARFDCGITEAKLGDSVSNDIQLAGSRCTLYRVQLPGFIFPTKILKITDRHDHQILLCKSLPNHKHRIEIEV